LRIFFGASPGVGKTLALLSAACQAHREGAELVVALVHSHGRAEIKALLAQLPGLAGVNVDQADRRDGLFDPQAVLAWALGRSEPIAVIDDLAHANAPGARHAKRWQDVVDLLDAGISVWSTLSVQNLESLSDVVSGMTGSRVRETIPDRVFDQADEVIVVDAPPDELIKRLATDPLPLNASASGRPASQYRMGTLLALRELALRRAADRVDGQMQAYRRRTLVQPVWANREALLACVGSGEDSEKVVRASARLAARLGVAWHALHVRTPEVERQSGLRRDHVMRLLSLAERLGATVSTLEAPELVGALIGYAREHNLSRLMVGRDPGRLSRLVSWRSSVAQRIASQADDLDVVQVAPGMRIKGDEEAARDGQGVREASQAPRGPKPMAWRGYAAAIAACVLTAVAATPLIGWLELTNIVMFFLAAVVAVGWFHGRGPAVLAAFLGVAFFDFFFVPPRFSFEVSDAQFLVTFAVMLAVALAVGQLTAVLKSQAGAAIDREKRMRGLYQMSRDLSAVLMPEQVAQIAAGFLQTYFDARCTVLLADEQGQLQALAGATASVDEALARWVFEHAQAAGLGTDTSAHSECMVLPLKAPMRLRGVLIVQPSNRLPVGPDQKGMLQTCVSLLAISLERLHYVEVAQKSTVQIESERLRNSLLSAISHDLRTPLAALYGLADTLTVTCESLPPAQMDMVCAIRESARRMNAMVANLLDMARLDAAPVALKRQWQPLEEVVGSALAACATFLGDRPVRVSLDPDLPLVHLDAPMFERVLVNLLENAAKFTPAGSAIELRARAMPASVIIEMDDFGPGLPAGAERTLFEKFERGGYRESAISGVGLGLAIARAIVQAHQGAIHASNRMQAESVAGARFTIELPRGNPPTDDGSAALYAFQSSRPA
jgi:two-component system sensor histidine kinase KdpD